MAKLTIGKKNAANNNESANVQNAQVSNPESPMMKQYRELKQKNPNALLLFRCGDFYETYEDDAKAAANVLGITLTKHADGYEMAGFPYHALDTYLPKLIRAGKRVAICDQIEAPKNNDNANVNDNDKPVTAPLGEHGTLVIGKPGIEPKSEKPKVTLKKKTPQPKSEEPVKVDEIVEVSSQLSALSSQLTFGTYTTKKGATAPQIMGFGGPDDPRWQSHKDKAHKWCSASYRRDLNGNKVYCLLFGVRYMDAAKALCEAYNSGDNKAVEAAEAGCQAVYEQAVADGKAHWEARKAEREAKKAAKNGPTPNPEGEGRKYDNKAVAEMLQAIMDGGDIPEDIKRHMKAA